MVTEKMIEAAKLFDDMSPEESIGAFGGSGQWVELFTVRDLRELEAALSTDAEPEGEIAGQQGRYWMEVDGRWSNWFDITFNTWVPEPGVREVRNLYAESPQIAPAATVRTLEWDDRGETIRDRFKAPSILGDYYVAREKSGLFSWRTYLLHGSIIVGNADEAKAAAQADYEARIRSALSAQVQDVATAREFADRMFKLSGFMLSEEYRGKPAVTITFPDNAERNQFYSAIVDLSTHKTPAAPAAKLEEKP